ncbi:MAG: aldehyde:ferredoxin oxidoreductase [Deltaproteobacteria bacterium]|nr:aldehyde:ferredoxin oxidoreductase [Deltaproteobacteria bacterium]
MIIAEMDYTPAEIVRGYTDRILRVDLTGSRIETEILPDDFKERWIGGRGYALKLIWDGTNEKTRYDSPENILVLAGGPLGAEPLFPGTGKFIAGTISPLTGTFIDSNVGGHFAPLLKLSGFDALAITGIAPEEVVLIIDGDAGKIRLIKAPQGEGAISYATELMETLCQGKGPENVAAIATGIGGKNSSFGIINSLFYDTRRRRVRSKQAGRGGTGTVMRHKGLKAIVVTNSLPRSKANRPANPEMVKEAGRKLKHVIRTQDPCYMNLRAWGTIVLIDYMNKYDILPVHNYQVGTHEEAHRLYSGVFKKEYFSSGYQDGCYYGCNLACAKGVEDITLKSGPYRGRKVSVDGPEYETAAIGPATGIFDPQFALEYNWYCDEYGLDTISTGVTMAFLMECFQRGFLTTDDIGHPLMWGDSERVLRLVHEIASGEGFGKIAGKGVRFLKGWVAETYGRNNNGDKDTILQELRKFGMECKGLEFSMYITKESLAQQGGYGFALKGAQHDEAWMIFMDQVHNELPTFELKAKALKWFPLFRTWFNATGLCKLPWIDVRHPEAANTPEPAKNLPSAQYFVEYYNGTVGINKTLDDLLKDSERLYTLQKLINLRHGVGTRGHDQIPLRAMSPVFVEEYRSRQERYDNQLAEMLGSKERLPINLQQRLDLLIGIRQKQYQELCDAVYKEKGYDRNGVPTQETLAKFDLSDAETQALIEKYGAKG